MAKRHRTAIHTLECTRAQTHAHIHTHLPRGTFTSLTNRQNSTPAPPPPILFSRSGNLELRGGCCYVSRVHMLARSSDYLQYAYHSRHMSLVTRHSSLVTRQMSRITHHSQPCIRIIHRLQLPATAKRYTLPLNNTNATSCSPAHSRRQTSRRPPPRTCCQNVAILQCGSASQNGGSDARGP